MAFKKLRGILDRKKKQPTGEVVKKMTSKLLTAKDVESISFSHKEGKLIRIGGNNVGDIYIGRLIFRGEQESKSHLPDGLLGHRVAIKRFKNPLKDGAAMKYMRVIKDLNKAGVRLPKMDMLKIPTKKYPSGEWVLVSQLFGSVKRGSKISDNAGIGIKTKKPLEEAIIELTKIANAGYVPFFDILESFHGKVEGAIPIDIDQLVWMGKGHSSGYLAGILKDRIVELSQRKGGNFQELSDIVRKNASYKLRKCLERIK